MAFHVVKPLIGTDPSVVPKTLRPAPIAPLGPEARTRELLLFEGTDEFGRIHAMLGTAEEGMMHWADPITENPSLNDVEIWEIYHTTEDAHPIHIHLVQFQVLSRQKFHATVDEEMGALSDIRLLGQPKPPAANEAGFKDTVQMMPGEVTRVIAKFDREGLYPGLRTGHVDGAASPWWQLTCNPAVRTALSAQLGCKSLCLPNFRRGPSVCAQSRLS